MKTVTICGSMRFAREMRRAAFLLESRQGCNVLQCTYPEPGDTVTPEMRQRLEEAHLEKIRISDFIYVVDVGLSLIHISKALMTWAAFQPRAFWALGEEYSPPVRSRYK